MHYPMLYFDAGKNGWQGFFVQCLFSDPGITSKTELKSNKNEDPFQQCFWDQTVKNVASRRVYRILNYCEYSSLNKSIPSINLFFHMYFVSCFPFNILYFIPHYSFNIVFVVNPITIIFTLIDHNFIQFKLISVSVPPILYTLVN